ncbi:hypothetical protein ABZ368_05540 [Streptomyces sp. NPDC005908]|uniref:hypothetical protein n=1 Tax=Streptomyces sp. NPDC005908 TaxID=3157084 RepID=UPI0033D6BA25
MFLFVCAGCGAALTVPLSQVALPVHARQSYGSAIELPVLMEPGTFAVDSEPWGKPWRSWEDIGPQEAASRGVYAPVHALSYASPGAVVMAPGDTRGTVLLPGAAGGNCCGLDGGDGPNMACEACGRPVATRVDDCSLWQAVWLEPEAVRRLPAGNPPIPIPSWAELLEEGDGIPPMVPIRTKWASRLGLNHWWSWNPQWEAAAGQALAHLLAVSGRRPVTVSDGLAADVFQRALDTLLPSSGPPRRAVLAGPALPADTDADIVLVPTHPRTGELWAAPDSNGSARPVPLPFGIWSWMAFPEPRLRLPVSGTLPYGVLRDDPPPPRPDRLFRADAGTFQQTLARLPASRSPWLREVLTNLMDHMRAGIF